MDIDEFLRKLKQEYKNMLIDCNTKKLKSENKTAEAKTGVLSFDAVTGVTVDAHGHVTEVEKTNLSIQDTTYTLSGAKVETVTGGVKVTDTLTDSKGDTSTSVVTITSETLEMTAGTNAYTVDIKWGSF